MTVRSAVDPSLFGKAGRSLESTSTLRVFPRALVGVDGRRAFAARDLDRGDLVFKLPRLDRSHSFPMRRRGELVLRLARDVRFLRGVFGVAAHVHVVERAPEPVFDHAVDDRLIAGFHAAAHPVDVERGVGHRFLSSGDQHLLVARLDRLRGEHDGLESGAAHLVDGHRRHDAGDARLDRRLARRRLPEPPWNDVAHDDFVDSHRADPARARPRRWRRRRVGRGRVESRRGTSRSACGRRRG